MASSLSDLATNARLLIPGLQEQQQTALGNFTSTPDMTTDQKLNVGLLALAPLIAGIIKGGRTGLSTGAQMGLLGTQMYGKQLEGEQKEAQFKAKAEYDAATKELERQRDLAGKAEFKEAELEGKAQRKIGTGTNIDIKVDAAGSKQLTENILDADMQAKDTNRIADQVLSAVDRALASGEAKSDEGFLDASFRNIKAWADPANNPNAARLRRGVVEQMLTRLNTLNKGAPSDRDRELQETAAGTGYNIPVAQVKEIAERLKELAAQKVADYEEVAKGRGLSFPERVAAPSAAPSPAPTVAPRLPGETIQQYKARIGL